MLLAGDVGGTKTLLGLFAPAGGRPAVVTVATFTTIEHASLPAMVAAFMVRAGGPTIDAACFGVAGPVTGQRAQLTNVPWAVAASEVADACSFPSVTLLNDLEAMAWSVPVLGASEIEVLQRGDAVPGGNAALIAAGTGLGEALLHRVGTRLLASPSEGGHADYSPRTPREAALMQHLTAAYGRAEWEQVLSGPGLVNIHRFTHTGACPACNVPADPLMLPSAISRAALERRCPQCVEALDMFVAAYGAEAGNVALRFMATAGVYIGGGIAPKILPALKSPAFLQAFTAKLPMTALLERVPVSVILNEQAALVGAAVCANAALAR